MVFEGTFTAMITPFIGDKLDEKGLIENLHRQLEAGISGVVVLGTTGEASTLSPDEERRVVEIAVSEMKGKIPVIVGCGHYSTHITIEKTLKAKKWGANCALIVTPYYNKPTQEGIFRHYEAITKAVDLPILLYNIPGRCGVNIESSTMQRLAALQGIIGVKESSGNLALASEFISAKSGFTMLSGDDVLTLPLMSLGACGVISVVSNLFPKKVVALVKSAATGDFVRARKHHFDLLPFFRAAFIETNPVPIKTAMRLCGLPAGDVRLPLCELKKENVKHLEEVLLQLCDRHTDFFLQKKRPLLWSRT